MIDTATGSSVTTLLTDSSSLNAASFAQDGNHIFFGGNDLEVHIFNGTGFNGT